MSTSPKEINDLAEELVQGAKEVHWRNAAARAYYAGYHKAKQVAQYCPSNDHLQMGSHERVSNRFDLEKSNKAKSISYVLQAMKKVRKVADYEIDGGFHKATAQSQIDLCFELFDKLDKFDQIAAAKQG